MALYRLILTLLSPLAAAYLLWRRLTRRDSPRTSSERLGGGPALPAAPRRLWLHGASNGELTSARALIEGLLAEMPDLSLIITCNTETARAMVEAWALPRTRAAIAPLDYRPALARFLARTRPTALAILENEIWPNRIAMMQARGTPVLLIGARISAASARNWARADLLLRPLLAGLAFVSAQDAASQDRLRSLGADPARIGPPMNLKARLAPPDAAPLPPDLAEAFDPATTLLAASTHPGEEQVVLDGFTRARAAGHLTRLILAPRHPRRSAEVAALIAATGLPFATRSAGEPPGDAPVYLADTMGEMALWYRLAGVTFTGGSLGPEGGHTPFEPAACGSAILHGPNVANFAEVYAALDTGGGALCLQDAESLATALTRLADPARRAAMTAAARRILTTQATGGTEALRQALTTALH